MNLDRMAVVLVLHEQQPAIQAIRETLQTMSPTDARIVLAYLEAHYAVANIAPRSEAIALAAQLYDLVDEEARKPFNVHLRFGG